MMNLRQALKRPERKPPQLFKVPFYEEAVRVFQQECDMAVSLELETSTTYGEPTWTVSAYSGPRSFAGLTANHVIPRKGDEMPTRIEVMSAAACLGASSRGAWDRRERLASAKAAIDQAGRSPGRIVRVD